MGDRDRIDDTAAAASASRRCAWRPSRAGEIRDGDEVVVDAPDDLAEEGLTVRRG